MVVYIVKKKGICKKNKMKFLKKDILIFIILFVFTLAMFYGFLTMHYATDTYKIMEVGYEEYALEWSLADGRILMSLIRTTC